MDKIIINGMGVLGREIFRQLYVKYPDRIAAINDPNAAGDNLAYLLNYESNGKGFLQPIMTAALGKTEAAYTNDGKNDYIDVGGMSYILLHETTNHYVYDYVESGMVIDCTGATIKPAEAQDYMANGATHAIICNGINDPSTLIVYGVNDSNISQNSLSVISTGTSDLQAIAVVLKAIEDHAIGDQFEINSGSIRTITAYAASQQITDGYSIGSRFERGRSAAANIVPTKTNTDRWIGAVIPQLNGKFLGDEFRVPILQGGVFNLTLNLSSSLSKGTIAGYIKAAKQDGILSYTTDPIVSSDVVNSETLVTIPDGQIKVNGSLVNITGLYDNVAGFAAQIIRIAEAASKTL